MTPIIREETWAGTAGRIAALSQPQQERLHVPPPPFFPPVP